MPKSKSKKKRAQCGPGPISRRLRSVDAVPPEHDPTKDSPLPMTRLTCDPWRDPDGALQDLQRVAPTVVDLRLDCPDEKHLLALLSMPNLKRLELLGDDETPALPGGLPPVGLPTWLSVQGLPLEALQSILCAFAPSLETLQLTVGTNGLRAFPESCGQLGRHLECAALRALKRVVLVRHRPLGASHTPEDCTKQLAECRSVLPPNTQVLCCLCEQVEPEFLP
ncbi:uncharacterized protein LOC113211629 [Frankliniella occidentalis]|uniref:Uncharacterized protein LOC113211629 n=1 Tax=Frankliniella occidentalis TaxID=133901 RepID=A0A6J1T2J9_FRAOC|nr:uncharacterized protein LOC113211629 [Frankliniella occidentalis]